MSRDSHRLATAVRCVTLALGCLGSAFWCWNPEEETLSLFDSLRFPMGMILIGAILLSGYTLVSGPLGAPRKNVPTPSWRAEPRAQRRPPPEEGGSWQETGKLTPLQPRPGHHLVAAQALPPGDSVHLLPKD